MTVNGDLGKLLNVISSPQFALHAPNADPEGASRLEWALEGVALARRAAGPGVDPRATPPPLWDRIHVPLEPLSDAELSLVHNPAYLARLAHYAASGGGMLSVDTEVSRESYRVASLASAATWAGIGRSITTGRPSLAVVRPPGHHAGPAAGMGFCLINHVAVAARLFQGHGPSRHRVAIIDWDVHYGNGTAAIFAADPDCLYVSMHECPLYPYSGWYSENGTGPGTGTIVNLPLPGMLTDNQAVEAFRRIVVPCVSQFRPELVLVSAGLDGHWSDYMSSWRLSAAGYHRLAVLAREAALQSDAPVVAVLEGGYTRPALRLGIAAIAAGLAGVEPAQEVAGDAGPTYATAGHQDRAFDERLGELVSFHRQYWDIV